MERIETVSLKEALAANRLLREMGWEDAYTDEQVTEMWKAHPEVHPTPYNRPKSGGRYVFCPDHRPMERRYARVLRVSTQGEWVDMKIYTWAWSTSKRFPLPLDPGKVAFQDWGRFEIDEQQRDHENWMKEKGI